MSELKNLFKSSFYVLIIKSISAFSSLFIGYLIAKKINEEVVGEFYFGLALVIIFSSIVRMGGVNVIIKECSFRENENDSVKHRSSVLIFFLITTAALSFACYLTKNLLTFIFDFDFYEKYKSVFDVLFILVPLHAITFIICSVFQSCGRYFLSATFQNFIAYLSCVFFLLIIEHSSVDLILLSLSFGYLISSLVGLFFLCKLNLIKLSCMHIREKFTLKFLYDYMLSDFLTVLINWFPIVIIGMNLSKEDTGMFSIAAKLCWLISFMIVSINSIFGPEISKKIKDDKIAEALFLFNKVTLISLIITIPFILLLPYLMPFALSNISEYYNENIVIFYIMIFFQFISITLGPVYIFSLMSNNVKLAKNSLLFSLFLCCTGIYFSSFNNNLLLIGLFFGALTLLPRLVMSIFLFNKYKFISFLRFD